METSTLKDPVSVRSKTMAMFTLRVPESEMLPASKESGRPAFSSSFSTKINWDFSLGSRRAVQSSKEVTCDGYGQGIA